MLAALVVFRVLFATIYICGWKCKYCCNKKYDVKEKDLDREFKDIKKRNEEQGAPELSTDDEEIEEECNKIFKVHEKKITERGNTTGSMVGNSMMMSHRLKGSELDMTIDYMAGQIKEENSDSDDDFKEFDDADIEEAEDRIYDAYKKQGKLDESEIQELARNADVSLLEQSIVISAKRGNFAPAPYMRRSRQNFPGKSPVQSQQFMANQLLHGLDNLKASELTDDRKNSGASNPLGDSGRSTERIAAAKQIIRKNSGHD